MMSIPFFCVSILRGTVYTFIFNFQLSILHSAFTPLIDNLAQFGDFVGKSGKLGDAQSLATDIGIKTAIGDGLLCAGLP